MESKDCQGGFFSLKCNHNFCVECWTEYLKAHLSDIRQVLYTSCPHKNCKLIVSESLFNRFLTSEDSKLELKQGIQKNFTDYNSDMKWCPNKDCEGLVRCESKSNKEIDCICGNTFCFKCLKEGHRPTQCDMVSIWEKKAKSDGENVKWLTVNTKQCLKCNKFIEKNQGCDHMTCQKQAGGCGHEFCWLCFADWKGHTACNKFDKGKIIQNEKDKKSIKDDLRKYAHYFDRYNNHAKALVLVIRMRNSIEYSIHSFYNFKNVPLPELIFLRDGVESVIKSRRLLKYSYIFGYYLNEGKEKILFEHLQSKLESNANRLHELLENETMNTIIALNDYEDFNESFKKFRNSIIDLFTATNTFVGDLLVEIENNMIHLVDYKKLNEKLI